MIVNMTEDQFLNIPSTIWRILTTRGTSYAAVGGITLSISIALMTEFVLLTLLVRKRVHIPLKFLSKETLKKVLAGTIMTIFLYVFKLVPTIILDTERTLDTLLIIIVNCTVGLVIYFICLLILKDQSLNDILITTRKFIRKVYESLKLLKK